MLVKSRFYCRSTHNNALGESFRRKRKCHLINDLAWIPPRFKTGAAGAQEQQSPLAAAALAF
jgi:hypothetical protein